MANAKTAIVTGAGKRVGREIATALLDDGWCVVAHVHHQSDDVTEGAVKAVADLARSHCAEAIFASAEGLPPVRLLINNAARFAWDGFGELDFDEFHQHMAINARAPALLIERFAAGQSPEEISSSSIFSIQSSRFRTPITSVTPCRSMRSRD